LGEISGNEKAEFLGEAYALLFPIEGWEPFGSMMIEAIAYVTKVSKTVSRGSLSTC
jgi:glycosyltransferase involved in cell wall biosynthesis